MKEREFNLLLRDLSGKNKLLDKKKIAAASHPIRNSIINHLVRKRQAIVIEFINPDTDMKWLASCGYMYEGKNKDFTFLCTQENKPKA